MGGGAQYCNVPNCEQLTFCICVKHGKRSTQFSSQVIVMLFDTIIRVSMWRWPRHSISYLYYSNFQGLNKISLEWTFHNLIFKDCHVDIHTPPTFVKFLRIKFQGSRLICKISSHTVIVIYKIHYLVRKLTGGEPGMGTRQGRIGGVLAWESKSL